MNVPLLEDLHDARRRTLELVSDLTDEQVHVGKGELVNPFVWELGHIAFFFDAFVLAHVAGGALLLHQAERIYDSFKVDHDDRWDLPLPARAETLDYMHRVFDRVEALVRERGDAADVGYCCRLATLHEDMHGEAFLAMRQHLGHPAPSRPSADDSGPWPGDVRVAGGTFLLGADPATTWFVFDNEKWAHPVELAEFKIARAPVTNAEFAEFVDDGGYHREELWRFEGWRWRRRVSAEAPVYWVRRDGAWHERWFDTTIPLRPHRPIGHVGFHEAVAFCNWAGRRLPTEAEWEMAASFDPRTGRKRRYPWGDEAPVSGANDGHANLDSLAGCLDVAACARGDSAVGCRQMLGNVWEWTDSAFYPFPGYVVDEPYREYSAPWFGYRQVLKGGCFATRSRLAHNVYRNFFTPDRRDVIAGFRTCAR